jgi:hypothetical protein
LSINGTYVAINVFYLAVNAYFLVRVALSIPITRIVFDLGRFYWAKLDDFAGKIEESETLNNINPSSIWQLLNEDQKYP